MPKQWYEKDERRLRIEIMGVKSKFPQFELYVAGRDYRMLRKGVLFWQGSLRTNFGSVYTAIIVYPENFPYGEIKSYIQELLDKKTPHKYADGHLCLYHADMRRGWEGADKGTTAVTIIAWTAAWLNNYENWKRTGEWVGRSWEG